MARNRNLVYIGAGVGALAITMFFVGRTPPELPARHTAPPPSVSISPQSHSDIQRAPASAVSTSAQANAIADRAATNRDEAINIDPPRGDYSAMIPDLRERAKSGDAESAYTLSRILLDCLLVNKGKASGYGAANAAPDRCKGIEVSDANEARLWLQRAAENGVLAAQLLYWNSSSDLITPEDMFRDPKGVQEYKDKALSLLTSAASHGSVEAMIALSGAYSDGVNAEQNLQLAYAYRYAATLVRPDLTDPSTMFEGELSPDQVDKAKTIGNNIFSKCCR